MFNSFEILSKIENGMQLNRKIFCVVLWRLFNSMEVIQYCEGIPLSIAEDVQYCGVISSKLWGNTISRVEGVYYYEGFSLIWKATIQ